MKEANMPTYQLKINDEARDFETYKIALDLLEVSWEAPRRLVFSQKKQHHQADFEEEDKVELLVDGTCRFLGRIKDRDLVGSPGAEVVRYTAFGLRESAKSVNVTALDGTPRMVFNAEVIDEEDYDEQFADKKVGEIVKWLIDAFGGGLLLAEVLPVGTSTTLTADALAGDNVELSVEATSGFAAGDGVALSRGTDAQEAALITEVSDTTLTVARLEYDHSSGAAVEKPQAGYIQSELDALSVIPPKVVFFETHFDEALELILRFQPGFAFQIYPETRVYHFLKVSDLSQKTITYNSDDRPLSSLLAPSTRGRFTAYKIVGGPQHTTESLFLSSDDLEEYWEHSLEEDWTVDKAFAPENYDSGTCTSSNGVNTLTDSSKNWQADEWVGAIVRVEISSSAFQWREVTSNDATTLSIAPGNWSADPTNQPYELEKGYSPYRFVYSRYRIVDPAKRKIAKEITTPGALAPIVVYNISPRQPRIYRKWSTENSSTWGEAPGTFLYSSGIIITRFPIFTGDGTTPGEAEAVEDVRLDYAYLGNPLVARYPATGYAGTAYTQAGIRREKVKHDEAFIDPTDQAQYDELAQALLEPLKDIAYSGSLPLKKLDWSLVNLGFRINVTGQDDEGAPLTTGFEEIKSFLLSASYEFFSQTTTLNLSTSEGKFAFADFTELKEIIFWKNRVSELRRQQLGWLRLENYSIHISHTSDGGNEPAGGKSGEGEGKEYSAQDPITLATETFGHRSYSSGQDGNTAPCNYPPKWQ
jgi:hypothetical protein